MSNKRTGRNHLRRCLLGVGCWLAGAWLTSASEPVKVVERPVGKEPGQLGVSVRQQAPAPHQPATNQQLADEVARALRAARQLQGYRVQIMAQQGWVFLTGEVQSAAQQEELLQVARTVAGVAQAYGQCTITPVRIIVPTQAIDAIPGSPPKKEGPLLPEVPPPPTPVGKNRGDINGHLPEPANLLHGSPPRMQSPQPPPGVGVYAPPPMPYGAYNNYARMPPQQQQQYQPNQGEACDGPEYPSPKIPYGWRSINLTWEDGYWWYGRTSRGHDWWRVRYW